MRAITDNSQRLRLVLKSDERAGDTEDVREGITRPLTIRDAAGW
jgi:hypothetical protein